MRYYSNIAYFASISLLE
jgi:hypothetical protein